MQCRREDDGAIFEPSLSSSTFIGLDTQKPIDIAIVHSSQNIFDSTVGIIIKIRFKHRKHEMSCLFHLNNKYIKIFRDHPAHDPVFSSDWQIE